MTRIIQEDTIFAGPITFGTVPIETLGTITSATPNVAGVRYWKYVGGALTVTDFPGGNDIHTLYILSNGNLTLANNAKIVTNTGANKLLAANKVYTLHHFNGVWYEVA